MLDPTIYEQFPPDVYPDEYVFKLWHDQVESSGVGVASAPSDEGRRTVYLVMGYVSDGYDDHSTWTVAAFDDQAQADSFAWKANAWERNQDSRRTVLRGPSPFDPERVKFNSIRPATYEVEELTVVSPGVDPFPVAPSATRP